MVQLERCSETFVVEVVVEANFMGTGNLFHLVVSFAPTQTRLYKLERKSDGTLALTSDGANETTKWNKLPVPIKLASTTTSTTKVKQIDNRHSKSFNQVPKVKAKEGFVEQRTDAWLEILKAYESWSKLQNHRSAVISDLEFAKAYNTRQLNFPDWVQEYVPQISRSTLKAKNKCRQTADSLQALGGNYGNRQGKGRIDSHQ